MTKTETVKHLAGIDVGMKYDSLKLEQARKQLKTTGLYYKVETFAIRSTAGYQVYIILTEKFYFFPYDIGGELYSLRYGKPKRWVRARLGIEHSNFRGKAEILRANVSLWDWRSLGVGWYKPLLPSPWFFYIGASAQQYPDQVFPIDHSIVSGSATCGRKMPLNSRVECSVMPRYRRRILYDSMVVAVEDTEKVYEAFSLLRWKTDYRDNYFDPSNGWMVLFDLRSNALHSGIAPAFYQLYTDFRWYNPGLFKTHKFACRVTSIIRNTDAGSTHRLQLGGEGSVRGYDRGQFGRYFIANNSFTFSMEYRFPILYLPDMDLFPLSTFVPLFSSVSSRIDGALILDYGKVTEKFEDLFQLSSDHFESGMGIGVGLRAVTPTFERSVCVDLLWGTNPYNPDGYTTFIKKPMWHLYLDMYY